MRKLVSRGVLLALVLAVATPLVAGAEDPATTEYTFNVVKDDHKIRNKYDLSGSFVAHPGYNWGGLAEGATWDFDIHIKEAMNGAVSTGVIKFTTVTPSGTIEVVGQVKETKTSYNWADLAAIGTADYNGTTYNFMFFYAINNWGARDAVWFALTTSTLDAWWNSPSEPSIPFGDRAYQLHSINGAYSTYTTELPWDPKEIH